MSCTIKLPDEIPEPEPIFQFPRFPLSDGTPLLTEYLSNIIGESTRDQSKNPLWRKERLFRFTASKCKSLKEKKTSRGFPKLAEKFLDAKNDGPKPGTSAFVQKKLDHGIYYEPFAISCYENYLKQKNRPVTVLTCGLWASPKNFVLAATPDDRVIDPEEKDNPFGILEVKCPEEYKDYDPADSAIVVKEFCLILDDQRKPRINRNHGYFDQVQLQMGLTGAPWCDFIIYTLKGMVIDRVYFDVDHFVRLVNRIEIFTSTIFCQ